MKACKPLKHLVQVRTDCSLIDVTHAFSCTKPKPFGFLWV